MVSLEQNYRSQQTILDSAGAVIEHNKESVARYIPGIHQELVAQPSATPLPIEVRALIDEQAEDYFIAKEIVRLIDSGVSPREIAVLYRNNRDSQSLMSVLARLGVPVALEVGENLFEDYHIQLWLRLLAWIADGKDDSALVHIVQYSWWGLPAVDCLRVIHYAGKHYMSLFSVLSSRELLEKAGVVQTDVFMEFAKKLAIWREKASNEPLTQFLERLVVESEYLSHVMEDDSQAQSLRKLTTLLDEAKQLHQNNTDFKLEDFIAHIRLLREHGISLSVPAC